MVQNNRPDGGQDVGRAQGRVAGEGQLGEGGEDAQAPGVGGEIRRVYKDGFGEVELPCDSLHQRRIEAAGSGKHGELVAAEELPGEDISGVEWIAHGAPQLSSSNSPPPRPGMPGSQQGGGTITVATKMVNLRCIEQSSRTLEER